MSGVSLTEQMGAMALIDEMRHQRSEVQKHLDLPQHRQAVAERIREFYRTKGVEVEDALVQQGVSDFFATRLIHEAPPLRAWEKALAVAYVSRGSWFKWGLIWLPIILWSLYAWSQVFQSFGESRLRYTQTAVNQAYLRVSSLSQQFDQLQQRVSGLQSDTQVAQLPAAQRLLERARATLDKARPLTDLSLPKAQVTEQSRSDDFKRVFEANKSLNKDGVALDAVDAQLDQVSQLLMLSAQLQALSKTEALRSSTQPSAALVALLANARAALEQADIQGLATAQAAVEQVADFQKRAAALQAKLVPLKQAQDRVHKMGLSNAEAAQFQPLFAAVENAVEAFDDAAGERALKDVEALRAFATTALTLKVVSRVGEKSMVERNHDSTGGKSWYLLTEANDAQGNVVPVPVTSIETGEKRYAKIFGVRVNQATYIEAKNDKLADGHVDNNLMGTKASNSLTLKFVKGPVKTQPAYLLEWQ